MARFSASNEAIGRVCSPANILFTIIVVICFFKWLPGDPVKESIMMLSCVIIGLLEFIFLYIYYKKNDPTFRYLMTKRD